MRMLLALMMCCSMLSAAQGQEKKAEDLFRNALTSLEKAKTLKIAFQAKAELPEGGFTASGELILGEEGRYRLGMKVSDKGKEMTMLAISDGKRRFNQFDGRPGKEEPLDKMGVNAYIRGAVGRVGVVLGVMQAKPAKDKDVPDAVKDFPVSELKIGKETSRTIHELTYKVEHTGLSDARVILRLDAKTLLPLQRTTSFLVKKAEKALRITLVETYEVTAEPTLDAKAFAIPKGE